MSRTLVYGLVLIDCKYLRNKKSQTNRTEEIRDVNKSIEIIV